MPNMSRKRLLRSIRKEKDPVARERLRACLHRKDGCSIRCICKIMVRPYSTMRDWLWRMQGGGIRCRHDRRRGRRECIYVNPACGPDHILRLTCQLGVRLRYS